MSLQRQESARVRGTSYDGVHRAGEGQARGGEENAMQRNRRNVATTGLLAVIALAATACGSGTKALSEDSFITEMNAICRTADRALIKLDPNDPAYISDAVDIITTGFDAFTKLVPPKTLKADFDDYTANLDDQITQGTKLQKAIKAKDDAATKKAGDQLSALSKESDKLATSIGADKCVGVGDGGSTGNTTVDTTGNSTSDTSTANTPLPILTTPIETAPLDTSGSSSGSNTAGTLDDSVLKAPTGYSWEQSQPYNASALFNDPVLGPNVASYSFGRLKSTSDGSIVEVYVIEMNVSWTPELTAAYQKYEGVADGTDVTTPRNLPARQKVGAFNGADAIVLNAAKIGVSIVTATGVDGASILDAVVFEQQ
jgi:hypothetical protein